MDVQVCSLGEVLAEHVTVFSLESRCHRLAATTTELDAPAAVTDGLIDGEGALYAAVSVAVVGRCRVWWGRGMEVPALIDGVECSR